MRILFIHPSGAYGGSAKSLIEVCGALNDIGVSNCILAPRGDCVEKFREAGLTVLTFFGLPQFDNTLYGHYRSFRWLLLIREFIYIIPFIFGLFQIRRSSFEIIHINDITLLPAGLLAKIYFNVPLIVHVRSVQRAKPNSLRVRITNSLLARYADKVVAIDHSVANSLSEQRHVTVVRNSLATRSSCHDISSGRHLRVGFIGVWARHKGLLELLDAINILKDRNIMIDCRVAGAPIRKVTNLFAKFLDLLKVDADYEKKIHEKIKHLGLKSQVDLLGPVDDLEEFYNSVDVVCFPSYLNAAGRPVFEAAMFGRPSVVAIMDPPVDAVIHGKTGIAIPSPDPRCIAVALEKLSSDRTLLSFMGRNARIWGQKYFNPHKNISEMLSIYDEVAKRVKCRER